MVFSGLESVDFQGKKPGNQPPDFLSISFLLGRPPVVSWRSSSRLTRPISMVAEPGKPQTGLIQDCHDFQMAHISLSWARPHVNASPKTDLCLTCGRMFFACFLGSKWSPDGPRTGPGRALDALSLPGKRSPDALSPPGKRGPCALSPPGKRNPRALVSARQEKPARPVSARQERPARPFSTRQKRPARPCLCRAKKGVCRGVH